MTDLDTAAVAEAPAETPSTVIDTSDKVDPSGAGIPKAQPEEKPSLRETIAQVVKEEKPEEKPKDEAPADDKAKAEAKPAEKEKAPEDKPAEPASKSPDKPAAEEQQAQRPNGKYREIVAPTRLMPDAKEVWANVPRAVQRDVEAIIGQYEKDVESHKATTQRYEAIRPFDELARQNGRDLRESLLRMNQVENLMQRNPLAGLNAVLQEIGPRKADGSPVSLYEVASHIVQQGPEGYQRTMAQAQGQQQQERTQSEAQQIQQERAQLEREREAMRVEGEIIAPFKAEHPRYDELQDDIALFLKSGKIPDNLSPAEKLEVAYAMAERINPPSHGKATQPGLSPEPEARVEPDLSGSKSIKSAPGSISATEEPLRKGSIRDKLREEFRRGRSG